MERSTKILIKRFESDFTRPWESPPVMNRTMVVPTSPANKDKEKSPIRQSIKNLLSVFINKRNASGEKRVAPDLGLEPEPERRYGFKPRTDFERNAIETRPAATGKALPRVPPRCAPDDDDNDNNNENNENNNNNDRGAKRPRGVALFDAPVPPVSLSSGTLSDSAPKKKQLCGVLLYQSQYPNNFSSFHVQQLGSIWLPCIATLEAEDRSIRLSWSNPSSEGEHVLTHILSLARCADVRSLVPSQLDEQDTQLPLVGCKDELRIHEFKVFEVLFQGRGSEKLAARTVRDRARWVSAIWDVVLPSQDQVRMEALDRGRNANANLPLPSTAIRHLSSSSIYPPTRPTSRLSASGSVSTTTLEKCRSPSIMSLSQKSVVKQRLAQIKDLDLQRTRSVSSTSSRTASDKKSLSHHRWIENGQPTVTGVPDAVADQGTISARTDPEITCSIPDKLQAPSNITPLAGLLQNHAQEHREQVTHLEDRLIGLQDEIQRLPNEISCIVGNSRMDNAPSNSSIQQLVTKVDRKMESTVDVLGAIEDKLTALVNEYHHRHQMQSSVEDKNFAAAADVLRAIDGIHAQIKSDFPTVLARLAQIQEINEKSKNDRPPLAAERNKDLTPVVDLSTVLSKLDTMIALQRKATTPVGRADVSVKDIKDDLTKVFSLLEDNNQQRALHTQQQADSVRYLTELNTWLEAFVNHGTSQIESVSANVEQLCKILGCPDQNVDGTGQTNFLQELRGLVPNVQTQQSYAELQNSINGLLAVLNNSRLSELGSVIGVVERYRQDQVNLLKTMKTELSSEIKGERIRFVEAMKEATSINVQMHVEKLKQTLAAEVLKMSNEVGRMHQEKQVLESQIQDMLAFQDKQRFSNRAAEQAGTRYCHPYLEEYPNVTGQGALSFSGI